MLRAVMFGRFKLLRTCPNPPNLTVHSTTRRVFMASISYGVSPRMEDVMRQTTVTRTAESTNYTYENIRVCVPVETTQFLVDLQNLVDRTLPILENPEQLQDNPLQERVTLIKGCITALKETLPVMRDGLASLTGIVQGKEEHPGYLIIKSQYEEFEKLNKNLNDIFSKLAPSSQSEGKS